MRKILFLVSIFVLILSGIPSLSEAQNRVIDDVEIVKNPAGTEVHIFFNSFFQVTSHNPKENGDYLQVELRPVNSLALSTTDLLADENLVWAPTQDVPLLEITYEGLSSFADDDFTTPGNRLGVKDIRSRLKLRFQESVHFKVNASADLRSIVIFIPKKIAQIISGKAEKITAMFAINLMSTPAKVAQNQLPKDDLLRSKQLYMAQAQVKGQTWYRWRLGFFGTKALATQALEGIQKLFPDAWVVKVSHGEREQQITQKKVAHEKKAFPKRKARPLTPERLTALLEEAEKEMTAKNYKRAIQLYSRILQHPDPVSQQRALEILGLARERKGQQAHAKALYEEYLAKYPETDGALRVRQRLNGMLTARSQPKESLRKARKILPGDQWEKELFGSIAQYYQYDESTTDGDHRENLNSLTSDADVNLRLRNETYDIQAAFVGSNENDFTENKDDEARISDLNIDFLNRKNSLYGKIGRQSVNTGGVLGRFDGVLASYQITPTIKMNGVIGYPVESSRVTNIEKNKEFYGVNFDLGTFAESWDYNLFFIEQDVDDTIDRRAIGGEVKYYAPNLSLFTLLDYDIFYKRLNTLLVVGNWKASEQTTFNVQIDLRRSPLLTTSNALSGQSVETIESLKTLFTEEQINVLAEDRTAETTSQLIGITHDFNDHWQFYGDATKTNTGDTIASGGVDAIPGTGDEYFYNTQLIGNGLVKEGDLLILGVRYSDLSTRDSILLSLNARYPVTRNFRVNPRVQFEFRENDDGSGDRTRWNPSLRLDYRIKKNLRLELESGSEYIHEEKNNVTSDTDRYYLIFRYRFLF